MLRDLYTGLYDTDKITPENCRDLTPRLNAVAGGDVSWSWRHIYSVLKGYKGFTEKPELTHAAQIIAVGLDGSHPWQAAREIVVRSPNGVKPGSVVTGHSINCEGCGVLFVPNVPWRTHCQICRPPRERK